VHGWKVNKQPRKETNLWTTQRKEH
jgi:hypothetical protein